MQKKWLWLLLVGVTVGGGILAGELDGMFGLTETDSMWLAWRVHNVYRLVLGGVTGGIITSLCR